MAQSISDALREELEYVGTAAHGETFNFSALGTFDHADIMIPKHMNQSHNNMIPLRVNGDGPIRSDIPPLNYNHNQMSGMGSSRTGSSSDKLQNGPPRGPMTPPGMNASPLSSVSKDDSSSDGVPYVSNTYSIFRPRQGDVIQNYRQQNPGMSSRQKGYDQKPNNGRQNNQRSTGYSYDHQESQKPYGGATRQVSTCDYNRHPAQGGSFDSFGSTRYSQNLAHIDSFMEGNKSLTSFDAADRRLDDRRNDDRQDSSSMYRSGGAPSQEARNERRIDNSTTIVRRNSSVSIPRTKTFPDIGSSYLFLRSRAKLFTSFSFLLPGLKMYVMKAANEDRNGWNGRGSYQTTRQEVMAKRRLTSAVLAFGGISPRSLKRNSSSYPSKEKEKSPQKAEYDRILPMRYFDNDARLSWDVEDDPPVGNPETSISDKSPKKIKKADDELKFKKEMNLSGDSEDPKEEGIQLFCGFVDKSKEDIDNNPKVKEAPKMKYRCKLCGQPKQNHSCPFTQELQRSIGTMSYPALNAFQCSEPGLVAPALSSMNNFTDLEEDDTGMLSRSGDENDKVIVTPDSGKSKKRRLHQPNYSSSMAYGLVGKKRRVGKDEKQQRYGGDESLILPTMEIKPEQYRTVSSRPEANHNAFEYPAMPLTFRQRKSASDSLFEFCQEITGLTEECSSVLHQARKTDLWDLAIAELIVQTLVMLYCPSNDYTLEGLKRYLLTMGISC